MHWVLVVNHQWFLAIGTINEPLVSHCWWVISSINQYKSPSKHNQVPKTMLHNLCGYWLTMDQWETIDESWSLKVPIDVVDQVPPKLDPGIETSYGCDRWMVMKVLFAINKSLWTVYRNISPEIELLLMITNHQVDGKPICYQLYNQCQFSLPHLWSIEGLQGCDGVPQRLKCYPSWINMKHQAINQLEWIVDIAVVKWVFLINREPQSYGVFITTDG